MKLYIKGCNKSTLPPRAGDRKRNRTGVMAVVELD
jgi:hypothetical protein